MRLEGKVAIVTGAAQGIGRATATLFAKEGAEVVAVDWNDDVGKEAVSKIHEQEGKAIYVHADVSIEDDIKSMIQSTVDTYGAIDILVNNAAYTGISSPVVELSVEEWDRIVAVTLKGAFMACKYAIPHMIEEGGGSIVNVSSVGGVVAFEDNPAYLASKGGLIQLTKGIALDYADRGIRANAISPGTIFTEGTSWITDYPEVMERIESRTLLKRQGTAEEMANVILFLASDEASYVTGANFIADGGWTTI
jgi:NAD(P)-dependent dehydrogenase (short-subunit alcohol dehydrogenase family)